MYGFCRRVFGPHIAAAVEAVPISVAASGDAVVAVRAALTVTCDARCSTILRTKTEIARKGNAKCVRLNVFGLQVDFDRIFISINI